jgi:hypothetical protein
MRESITLTAICLRAVDHGERARIATYFTCEQGRVDVVIPQARSKQAKQSGATDSGTVFRLQVQPPRGASSLYRLEQFDVLQTFVASDVDPYPSYEQLTQSLDLLYRLSQGLTDVDLLARERLFVQWRSVLACWASGVDVSTNMWVTLWFWQGVWQASGHIPSWAWDVCQQAPLDSTRAVVYVPIAGGLSVTSVLSETSHAVSKGTHLALQVLEQLQNESVVRLLDLPVPPLKTLEKCTDFYAFILESYRANVTGV